MVADRLGLINAPRLSAFRSQLECLLLLSESQSSPLMWGNVCSALLSINLSHQT